MKKYKVDSIMILVLLLVVILGGMSAYCLLTGDNGMPYIFRTHRGTEVMIFGGNGVYREDSVLKALMMHAFDMANIFLIIPLLLIGLYLYKRRSLIGFLILLSGFMYLFYNYLLGVMMQSYNQFYLCYILIYSISLFTGIYLIRKYMLVLKQRDRGEGQDVSDRLPKKTIVLLLFIIAGAFLFMGLQENIMPLFSKQIPPGLGNYTTMESSATDMGLIVPFVIMTGIMILKNNKISLIIAVSFLLFTLSTLISLNTYQMIGITYAGGKYVTFNLALVLIMLVTGIVCAKSLMGLRGLHISSD